MMAAGTICLSVCLYPINVKTAEPIGPKFFVGPDMTLDSEARNKINLKNLLDKEKISV